MSNLVFLALLGCLSAVGIAVGYSWEPVAAVAGGAVSLYALLKQEVSERILRLIAKDASAIADLRKELRGRLSGLIQRVYRRSSREPPTGPRQR